MTSRVLVTGGAGFIGSHVVDRLIAAGHRPRIFDVRPSAWHDPRNVETALGDVCRAPDVVRALRGCDAVCHLAAAADVDQVLRSPASSTDLNAMGTVNVLEAARECGVDRVVYASTVWVYSDVEAEEVDEQTLLPLPAHLYTAGKLSGELFCRSYAELYGLKPTVLRFGIPYGPRARPAAVIPAFVNRALAGEAVTIAGTGEQERAFVYVEDLAEGVVRALAPAAAGRVYNLATTETVTIRRLAEIVDEHVAPVEIVHTEGRTGDARGQRVCSDRAREELGWTASTPIEVGVRRYADWLREQCSELAPATPVHAVPARRRLRAVATRLGHAAADPVIVGAMAMIAVLSSLIQIVASDPDRIHPTALVSIGTALFLPLWSITVAHWAPDLQRAQAAAAALFGAFEVVLLGLVDATRLATVSHRAELLLLTLSAVAAALVQILPRRVSGVDSA
jgi:UDP-glucose 4-epimerase